METTFQLHNVYLEKMIMKKAITYSCLFLAINVAFAGSEIQHNYKSGFRFTENKGQVVDMALQTRPDILYYGDGNGSKVYLRKTGVSYVMVKTKVEENTNDNLLPKNAMAMMGKGMKGPEIESIHRIDMNFLGCNTNVAVENKNELGGYSNYYLGHCPNGITNVKSFNTIVYKNIYNNTDVVFYAKENNELKYDIIVKPGGDPNMIQLNYEGYDNIQLENGKLKVQSSLGVMTECIPKVYQNVNGEIVDVECRYILNGATVSFQLSAYNPQLPLVIDPWATYLGGSWIDWSTSIANDGNNIVITGMTQSINFPISVGAFQTIASSGQNFDAFAAKFDVNGNRLWSTFYGSLSSSERAEDVACNSNGDIVITGEVLGWPNSTWLTSPGAFQTTFSGNVDAFIVKFDANGFRQWATLYGGSNDDYGVSIDFDNVGNIVTTGTTNSFNFPVTTSAFQSVLYGNIFSPGLYINMKTGVYGNGANRNINFDVFLVKFNATGNRIWATYCGGSGADCGESIKTDFFGNVIITGHTTSSDFPFTSSAIQTQYAGGNASQSNYYTDGDIIVAKFNSGGNLLWATYYGGSGNEAGWGVDVDFNNNIYICGLTSSSNFPVSSGAAQQVYSGGTYDAFVLSLDGSGNLRWCTYHGSTLEDCFYDIDVDNVNRKVFACGWGNNVNNCSFQYLNNSTSQGLFAKYDFNGDYICSGFVGDASTFASGITTLGINNYITGATYGAIPINGNSFQSIIGGNMDAFIVQKCMTNCGSDFVSAFSYSSNPLHNCTASIDYTDLSNLCDTVENPVKVSTEIPTKVSSSILINMSMYS